MQYFIKYTNIDNEGTLSILMICIKMAMAWKKL
jgi:hypothetical protein